MLLLPGETARLCIWEVKQLDKSMETVFVGFVFVGFVGFCWFFVVVIVFFLPLDLCQLITVKQQNKGSLERLKTG